MIYQPGSRRPGTLRRRNRCPGLQALCRPRAGTVRARGKPLHEPSQARTARQSVDETRRTNRAAAPAPLVLGRYRLHRRLGAGAFGTVWLARDERLERDVAVKILPRERIVSGRFEREARAAARLSHPAIVTLYEAAVDDEGAYLVSELVRGATLDQLLAAGQLSDRDIVSIGIALCDALEHAHAQGVVHRDVKPSNVLVPDHPVTPPQCAKLTDFGVARVIGGDSLTMTGDVIGTLAYMAPEQAEGLQAGASADLYSLALVLYEALTGVNPVGTGSAAHRAPPPRRAPAAAAPPAPRPAAANSGRGSTWRCARARASAARISELHGALAAVREQVGDEPGVVAAAVRVRRRDRARRRRPASQASPWAEPRRTGLTGAQPSPAPDGEPSAEPPNAARPVAGARPGRARGRRADRLARRPRARLGAAPARARGRSRPGRDPVAAAGRLVGADRRRRRARRDRGPRRTRARALLALALPVVLMVRSPSAWPLAAGAPALGVIGLAGAWPALAGAGDDALAAGGARRDRLGLARARGTGRGRVLYLPALPASAAADRLGRLATATVASRAVRRCSARACLRRRWSGPVLPLSCRGSCGARSPVVDLVRVVIWSAMLAGATAWS